MPKLNIRLKARSDETKSQQIASQLADAIQSGRLNPGDSLVSERALSEQLGVNRKTVRAAYDSLAEQGLIETVSTAGRRVRETGARKTAKRPATAAAGQSTRGASPARSGASGKARKAAAKG